MFGIPSALFIFLFNTLKSTEKVLSVDLLRLNTPRGTKKTFSTPERYDELISSPGIVYPLGDLFKALVHSDSRYQLHCCWLIRFHCCCNCIFQMPFCISYYKLLTQVYYSGIIIFILTRKKQLFSNRRFLSHILDCDSPMGMENENISDSALKASSEVTEY